MRVAIVTGASKGLGRALTGGLAGNGWTVVVDARDGEMLAQAAAQINDDPDVGLAGGSVVAVPGDITDEAHRGDLVTAAREVGPIDLVVNNAGALGPTPLLPVREVGVDDLRSIFEVNVVAQTALIALVVPHLTESGGALINVTSDAAVEAYEGWGSYGASKAALEHLTRTLAVEEPAIRAWTVDPGDMRTDMHQAAFPGEDISDRPDPSTSVPGILELIESALPSGRYIAREIHADQAAGTRR